jgi:nucleoside-diphosphate-sugar epimerase
VGEVFNVNGAERLTWSEYFRALNAALGLPELVPARPAASHLSAHLMQPVRGFAKFLLAHGQQQIMALYQRYGWAKALMRRAEGMIRKTPTPGEFALLRRRASFPSAKAEARLGWKPVFSMRDGVELSAAWLRHHGYAPAAGPRRG